MSVYWDTSALLSLSPEVFVKLREPSRQFTLSHVTELEIVSAVSRIPRRRDETSAGLLRAVLSVHRRLEKLSLRSRLDELFSNARRLAVKHGLGANDSLHLAAALHVEGSVTDAVEMASHDRRLRAAAAAEGLVLFPE